MELDLNKMRKAAGLPEKKQSTVHLSEAAGGKRMRQVAGLPPLTEADDMVAKARSIIAKARKDLGDKMPSGLADLLLDNMPQLKSSAEAQALLKQIGEK